MSYRPMFVALLLCPLVRLPLSAQAASGNSTPPDQATAGRVGVGTAKVAAAVTEGVTAALKGQAAAWNRGDLDAFVGYYTADATFAGSGTEITRGVDRIRQRYADGYFAAGSKRDTLSFPSIEARTITDRDAYALVIYRLSRKTATGTDSVVATGPSSLVLRKVGARWKIRHDHSS